MPLKNILIKYWGHTTFRPLQEEIIDSVMQGNDTLALLPTGGGKSLCFQVPALAKEGICLVITPLIALMKDQVEKLNKKGIKAIAIYSGMHKNEIDIALDNCVYGDIKFLYLSPERLTTDIFRMRVRKMNVSLIAVDEAHCISQWGYDFRPPYLKIAEVRDYIPNVPILALTATATPKVIIDIQEKLEFKKKHVIQKSFARENLIYAVLLEEDKLNRLLKMLNKVNGSCIIYASSRRRTKEVSDFLINNGVNADFYHAGLEQNVRDAKQEAWMRGSKRVMVSTNAFGMGIDKSNVRLVIHFDIPESIEAYFQEAGRAGRDEKNAWAIQMYNRSDLIDAETRLQQSFPTIEEIKNVYQALGNYFQLPVGSGKEMSFDFDISQFSYQYNFKPLTVFNSLRFIEKEGYILTTDAINKQSKAHILLNKTELYRFQVDNKVFDDIIKLLLRSYGGILTDFVTINESDMASRAKVSKETIIHLLEKLHKLNVLVYTPQKKLPQIIFAIERLDIVDILFAKENYEIRKQNAINRFESIKNYITSNSKCRSVALLSYFGETETHRCCKCDVCLERNKLELSDYEFEFVLNQIKPMLTSKPSSLVDVVSNIKGVSEDQSLKVIQWLFDNDKIIYDPDNLLTWKMK